jgi:hypothetical protein
MLGCLLAACGSETPAAPPAAGTPPATTATAGGAAPTTGTSTTPTPADATPSKGPSPMTPTSGTSMTPAASAPPAAASNPTPAAGAAGAGAAPAPTTMEPVAAGPKEDPRGKCTINSGYADDKACLLPPPPEVGMQIHIGPKDYTNAAEVAQYIMRPGEETSACWTFHTPNDKPIFYQTYELSGRAGTHHVINTMFSTELADGGFGVCADPGTGTNAAIIDNLPGASKAYMPRGTVAPENKNIGRMIPPNTASQADMHYFNFTDKDIIREFWMNIFYVPESEVKEQADQIRAMGGITWSVLPIAPGTDMVYAYECPITGDGRILSLLGHYHAHGKQFTASIRRGGSGQVEKVFEMFDYLDPAQFEYNSVSMNPAFAPGQAGAVSGILEVKAGDTIMWDCHIINDGDVGLTYTNMVKTGEMCNLWGSSLGIDQINCVL